MCICSNYKYRVPTTTNIFGNSNFANTIDYKKHSTIISDNCKWFVTISTTQHHEFGLLLKTN